MTLVEAKAGGWAVDEILTSTQMNTLQSELVKAVDGDGGGTYTLSAPLIFTGDDVRLDSDDIDIVAGGELTVLASATLAIEASGQLLVEASGTLNCDGAANIRTGALVTVESGGNVLFESGSDLTVENGATFLVEQGVAATLQMGSGASSIFFTGSTLDVKSTATFIIGEQETLQIDTPSVRTGLIPLEDGEPTQASVLAGIGWIFTGQRWTNSVTSSAKDVRFPIRLSPGDVLESVTVRIDGGSSHGALPANLPSVAVQDTTESTGASVALGSTTDAPANVGAYETAHDIAVGSLSHTVVSGHRISIRVIGESGANAVDEELDILSVSVTYRRNRMRQTEEVL